MISFGPTEEQELIQSTLREFAQDVLRPAARDADEASATSLPALLANAIALSASRNVMPPWMISNPLHISRRTVIRTVAPSADASTSSMPNSSADGSLL